MYDLRFEICDLRLKHTLNHNAPASPPSPPSPSSPPNPAILCCLAVTVLLSACADSDSAALSRAPEIANVIDGVVFEAGNWEPHLAAGAEGMSWGNHRAVVVLDSAGGDAVIVTIPWRRRDRDPAAKSIVVVDAASNTSVANAMALSVENVSGDIVFQPNPGSTTYHVYYMPWESTGGYYPRVSYPEIVSISDAAFSVRICARVLNRNGK